MLKRTEPYQSGDVVEMRGLAETESATLVTPDGREIVVETPRGRLSYQVSQIGVWKYRFSDQEGEFEVVSSSASGLAQGGSTAPMPTASLSSRPS